MKKRILIDPGHVGKSFFDFRDFTINNIQFNEGDFCYAWAEVLKKFIVEKGNDCVLSRIKGQPSLVIDPEFQLRRKRELILNIGVEASLKKFRVPRKFFPEHSVEELLEAAIQNEADLLNRAKIANENKFDFCLSLHLNGDPNSLKTEKNGICGFTNHISKSHYYLFQNIIENIANTTKLQVIENDDLEKVGKGLFIDDSLTLLKNIKVPTLLIEGPFQNNPNELLVLEQSLKKFNNGTDVSGRLEELTRAIMSVL